MLVESWDAALRQSAVEPQAPARLLLQPFHWPQLGRGPRPEQMGSSWGGPCPRLPARPASGISSSAPWRGRRRGCGFWGPPEGGGGGKEAFRAPREQAPSRRTEGPLRELTWLFRP